MTQGKDKIEKKLIFVVEDEPDIQQLIAINLKKAGFDVECFGWSSLMLSKLEKRRPVLILLDLMLPDRDGLDVCKTLKNSEKYEGIPVIMVTARVEESDVVLGLELGADDYIAKPFSPRELIARVKAVLRRFQAAREPGLDKIEIGDLLVIYPKKFEVTVKERKIQLTTTEFSILKMLAEKQGWVFSREKILDLLWGDEKDVFDRTVDVHIKNLRDKLGEAGKFIKNIRGVGYKLEV